jgi:hypothetical protein
VVPPDPAAAPVDNDGTLGDISCVRLRLLLVVLWVVLASVSCRKTAPESPVHFAREEIAMDVRPGTLEVRGMYHFTCSAREPLVASIFYPFPLDSTHLYPDSIELRTPTANRQTADSGVRRSALELRTFVRQDSGVSFRMRFRPSAEDSFFAYYRQPLKTNSATYIVTTTRKWKRPIDLAQFRITVPASFKDVRLTFKADSMVGSGSTVSYFFTRKKFYPDKDITVTWR